MPSHVILLRIFVGSPGGLDGARRKFRKAVDRLNIAVALNQGLCLQVVGWEDVPAGAGDPQERILQRLRECDLLVVIMGKRFGSPTKDAPSGTVDEFRTAYDLYKLGQLDDLKLYFASSLEVDATDRGAVEQAQQVDDWRKEIEHERSVYYHRYNDLRDLESRMQFDLMDWLRGWSEIIQSAMPRLGVVEETSDADNIIQFAPLRERAEVRLRTWSERDPDYEEKFPLLEELAFRSYFALDHRGIDILRNWSQSEVEAASLIAPPLLPLTLVPEAWWKRPAGGKKRKAAADGAETHATTAAAAVIDSPQAWLNASFPDEIMLVNDDGFIFVRPELLWFLIANRLFRAIQAGDSSPMRNRPFVNEVHQLLSILVRNDPKAGETLRGWLRSARHVGKSEHEIVRNFAAFVLGMSQNRDAINDLLDAVRSDRGKDVRVYSAMALGMIKDRRIVPKLLKLIRTLDDEDVRLRLHQAVLYIKNIIPNPYW